MVGVGGLGLGSRSGMGLGRGCDSGGYTCTALVSSCASTSRRSSRSSCGAPGRWAAVTGRTRASASAAPCAAWSGARCVGRCGGTGGRGTVGCISDSGSSSHCCTASTQKMKSSSPVQRDRERAQQRPSLCPEPGGRRRTWKMVALICFWRQGLALPELLQAGHERRKPLLRPEIELRVDGHLVH